MLVGPDGQVFREKKGNEAGNEDPDDKGFCYIR
jgi:hypothetical protein